MKLLQYIVWIYFSILQPNSTTRAPRKAITRSNPNTDKDGHCSFGKSIKHVFASGTLTHAKNEITYTEHLNFVSPL